MRREADTDTQGAPRGTRLCSVVSKAAGDDPAGSGGPFGGFLAVEVPQPWKGDITESVHFPEGLRDALEVLQDAGVVDKFTGLLPDPDHSREGHARVLFWRRPGKGPFAAYERHEYLVPKKDLAALVRALAEPRDLARFGAHREESPGVRDVLVCTHGGRDVCCGKFGYAVYNFLRSRHAEPGRLRVWRTSHIGGHRFAPTLLELPEGRYWGHLELGAAGELVTRRAHPSTLARFYRGWAGFGSHFEQIAERGILAREGWGWSGYPKEGRVLRTDGDGRRAEVRIAYRTPDGVAGAYEALVEASGSVMTLASSGADPLEEVEQYRIVRLEKVP